MTDKDIKDLATREYENWRKQQDLVNQMKAERWRKEVEGE